MKKLLLLLMAILLFAPPRAKAEDKTAVIFSNTWRTATTSLKYRTTATGTWNTWSGINGTTYKPLQARSTVNGVQFEMSVPVVSTNTWSVKGNAVGSVVSGTTRYANDNLRYMIFYGSQKLKFAAYFGKIKQVKLTIGQNSSKPLPSNTSLWFCTGDDGNQAAVTVNYNNAGPTQGTSTTSSIVTLTNPTNKDDFEVWYNSSSAGCFIFEIEVTYEETEAPPVEAPVFTIKDGFGVQKTNIDGEEVYELPIENYGQKVTTFNLNGHADELYYTLSPDLAPLTTTTKASALAYTSYTSINNAFSKWIQLTPGDGIKHHKNTRIEDATLDAAEVYTLRAVAYSSISGEFSSETSVKVKFVRLPELEYDLEAMNTQNKTAMDFVLKDGVLHYKGYNPKIYFKNDRKLNPTVTSNAAAINFRYKIDYTNPTNSSTPNIIPNGGPIGPIEFINGTANELPVGGSSNTINASLVVTTQQFSSTTTAMSSYYWFAGAPNKISTFKIVSDNPSSGEAVTLPKIAKPNITLSESAKTATLSGGVYGYIASEIPVSVHSGYDWKDDGETGILKYQYADASNGIWQQTPSINEDDWKEVPADGTIKVTGTARLFVREEKEGYETSDYSFADFNKIAVEPVSSLDYNTLLGVDDAATAITMTEPVRLIGSFPLSDQTTSSSNVYLLFVADRDGNVLRVHIESDGDNPYSYDEYKYMMLDGLTGVLRKNKEMPELYVNSPSLNYAAFLSDPYSAKDKLGDDYPTYVPPTSTTVPTVADYSKLMYFGPLRWNKTDMNFADNDGNTVKLYQRIKTEVNVEQLEGRLADGVQYRIAGYVGYADGAPVILPRAIVAAPRLLAPNPINENAAPNELIDMDVISDNLTITVDTEGLAEQAELIWVKTSDVKDWLTNGKFDPTKIDWSNASTSTPAAAEATAAIENNQIEITNEDLTDGDCALAVKLSNEGFESSVVGVNFIKHAATSVYSIADFKTEVNKIVGGDHSKLPLNTDEYEGEHYFRFDGLARIREITPHYLYIRTTPGDGSNLPEDEDLSAHSILLYSKDGWDHLVAGIKLDLGNPTPTADIEATTPEVTSVPEPLKVGDVITNFALIPTKTKFGNLVGYASGFARTFRRVDNATGGSNEPMIKDAQDEENLTAFTEADRMLRYTVRNVQVKKDETTGEYTLKMPGNPVLNTKDVFEPVNGWDAVHDSEAYFDLTGVVMLADGSKAADEDGRYMLALIKYDIPGVTPAEAPVARLTGAGSDSDNMTFLTEAKVRLTSSDVADDTEEIYTIYYTTDGSDPRTSETAEKYKSGGFPIYATTIVKAYVVAKGHPNSEVSEFIVTRRAVENRYIVNFVNDAEAETPYHITATAKVVAKGGEYIFVRGTQGHYLPIHFDEASKEKMPEVGKYINDFVAEPHMVEAKGIGTVVRGAHVHAEYADLFKAAFDKPANIDEITAEPDEVTTLTTANARRFVRLTNVNLSNFKVETDDTDTQATQDNWILTTERGVNIDVNHKVLTPAFDWDAADDTKAAYYNVTGFAMIGDDGDIELWPTYVEKVTTTLPVDADFTNYIGARPQKEVRPSDVYYTVKFYPNSTVTLKPTGASSATIYYYISENAVDDVDETKWNVYGQPFAITKNCYIHAKAKREGYEESVHTHIQMILESGEGTQNPAKMSGRLVITHKENENGIPVVTIKPEDNTLAAGTYDIYYTTDGSTPTVDPKLLYKGPFEFPEGGYVLAILKEASKEFPGEVASLNVWYVPTGIDGIDSDRTDSDAVRAEGGNIIAPEGSEVYDLSGRRVNANGLRRGIYIVRVPGAAKAVKIKVD